MSNINLNQPPKNIITDLLNNKIIEYKEGFYYRNKNRSYKGSIF